MRTLVVILLVAGLGALSAPARADSAAEQLDAARSKLEEALRRGQPRARDVALAREYARAATALAAELRARRPVTTAQLNVLSAIVMRFRIESIGVVPHAVYAAIEWGDTLRSVNTKLQYDLEMEARGAAERTERTRAAEQRRAVDLARRAAAESLAQTAITHRFSQFTAEDSLDPAKIAAAFELAPADIIYTVRYGRSGRRYSSVLPSCTESTEAKPRAIAVDWRHNGQNSSTEISGPTPELVEGTPVLIWTRDGDRGVVVTADGAAWRVSSLDVFVRGIPAATGWPTSIAAPCLSPEAIAELEKVGQVAAGTSAKIAALDDAAFRCAVRTWASAQPQFDANDRANITDSTRGNRYSMLLDRIDAKVERTCAAPRKKLEAALTAVVAQRLQARMAALAAITLRLQRGDAPAP